jgi:hypothetical protein
MGWADKSDGELLALAARRFDLFVTADRSLALQQHLPFRGIAVVILVARNNRLATLRPLWSFSRHRRRWGRVEFASSKAVGRV